MKIRVTISLLLLAVLSFVMISANKGPGPFRPTYIDFKIPEGWPKPPTNIFANNKLTEEGFQLGKKLFYDGRLSKDGNFPCASCHQQFAAFSNFEHDFSHGFNNSFTQRNAPPLFNLAWMTSYHWDGGVNHIEVQPLSPLTAPNEMAESIDSIIRKLKKDTSYVRMFKAAFGTNEINSQRMLKALAMFTGTIVSSDSKYDKVKRGEAKFTYTEEEGYKTFKAKCNSCHTEPLFTNNEYRNNGLPLNTKTNDIGRMKITRDKNDSLKFKVPTLRNVGVTYPYMHDGRFFSLGQVIDHYRSNIVTEQPNLDTLLRNRIQMTNYEKQSLIYFLLTLTDTALIHNPRFAEN